MNNMYTAEKKQVILWAKRLYDKGLISGASGNISMKLGKKKILITAHNAYLGYLSRENLLVSSLEGKILEGKNKLTSEKKLHFDIHKNFEEKIVLHAHPPFTNLYFSRFNKLKKIDFESQVYLKDFKIVPQQGPNVLDSKPVIEALEKSNIAVLKNHGAVSIGSDFKTSFSLIEILEKQAKLSTILRNIGE